MRKIIVVKIGSSVIAPKGELDSKVVSRIVKDICIAEEELGCKFIVVSSGAIACGLTKTGYKRKPNDNHSLMAISSLGQIVLMDVFNSKLKRYGKKCAQLLLTWDDFNSRRRFINIQKTIAKLLKMNVIPIINENDAVSHQEIKCGDNDYLSALLADLIGADQLIMLSDVEGLFRKKELVKRVEKIDEKIESLVYKQNKIHTSGGMETKLEAATKANLAGISTRIVSGSKKNVISRVLKGEDIGTLFVSKEKIKKSRKRWIHSKQIKGYIKVDNGAKDALLDGGKSLLRVGVTEVSPGFIKGDAVAVIDEKGSVLGCGISNYDAESFSCESKKKFGKEVIHRDNFVKTISGWSYHPYRRFLKKTQRKS